MLDDEVEPSRAVAGRDVQSRLEVGQAAGLDPWVVPGHRVDAAAHQVRREHLGEPGGHALHPAPLAGEAEIRVHREPHRWDDVPLVEDLVAAQPDRLGQTEPVRHTAGSLGEPVVVPDALDPDPADLRDRQFEMIAASFIGRHRW